MSAVPTSLTDRRPAPDRRGDEERVPAPPVAHLPQAGREGVVATAVAVGAVLVVGLWWKDTAPGSIHGLPDQLTAVGRVTGLLGTYLALLEVVLMSRISWLDRLIGMDRLATWHRRNGQYCINLLVAHAAFILWGYARTDEVGLVAETKDVLTYPGVWLSAIALGLFVTVAVVSARAVRRRVRYQTWYAIHLATYAAIALAFTHQLSNGEDFAEHPVNRAVWIAMYIAVAALLAGYRIGCPLWRAARHRLRVQRVVAEGPGVWSVYISGRRLMDMGAEAGQFFSWRFLSRGRWLEAHPFSLSAAPNPHWLRITVKALGDHTAGLASLEPGTRVLAEGPYGAFTDRRRTRRRVLLLAGGIGIAPLRALFESLPAGPGDLTLVYRLSRTEDAVFRAELDDIARRRRATVHYLIGSRDQRPDPLAAESLDGLVPGLVAHDVYVCGPPGMVETARAQLRAAGVPARRIHAEAFAL